MTTKPLSKSQSQSDGITELKKLGFSDEIQQEPRRIVASISGLAKTGKTHVALTAPEPIFFFDIDRGTEGVLGKFQRAGRKIYVYTIRLHKGQKQNVYAELWADAKERIKAVCKLGTGTLVIDSASELYELARLAYFGKLTQIMPHHYTDVNSEWQKDILADVYDSSINAVFIHRLKPKYVDNVRTKEYDIAGFGGTDYLMQLNAVCFREKDADGKVVFSVRVDDCRKNAAIIGEVYHGVIPVVDSGSELVIDPVVNFEFLLTQVHGLEK